MQLFLKGSGFDCNPTNFVTNIKQGKQRRFTYAVVRLRNLYAFSAVLAA
jgi:hypothetical protein